MKRGQKIIFVQPLYDQKGRVRAPEGTKGVVFTAEPNSAGEVGIQPENKIYPLHRVPMSYVASIEHD